MTDGVSNGVYDLLNLQFELFALINVSQQLMISCVRESVMTWLQKAADGSASVYLRAASFRPQRRKQVMLLPEAAADLMSTRGESEAEKSTRIK